MTQQYKGAQVTTISRLRKREGIQQAVPVLVLFEPALVLPARTTPELHRSAGFTKWCSLFCQKGVVRPPTYWRLS